jgi:hypothetical protein
MLRDRNEELADMGSQQRKQRMREEEMERNLNAHMERKELAQQRELAIETKRGVESAEARARRESIESRKGELTRSQNLESLTRSQTLQDREERLRSDMEHKHNTERNQFSLKVSQKKSSSGGAFGSGDTQ